MCACMLRVVGRKVKTPTGALSLKEIRPGHILVGSRAVIIGIFYLGSLCVLNLMGVLMAEPDPKDTSELWVPLEMAGTVRRLVAP